MKPAREFSEAEQLEIFLQLRLIAIRHSRFEFPIHNLKKERFNGEEMRNLARIWVEKGWIVPAYPSRGPNVLGRWTLSEVVRAYQPGEAHVMAKEEKELYLQAARHAMRGNGTIKQGAFEEIAPHIGFLRLVEANIITKRTKEGGHDYILGPEHRIS